MELRPVFEAGGDDAIRDRDSGIEQTTPKRVFT